MQDRDVGTFEELVKFRRFRLNVIEFLKLHPDSSEIVLRDAIRNSSVTLLAVYEARAARAQPRQLDAARAA